MSIERCDDINQLHPKVKELAEKLLQEAKKQGLNVKIIDTYRSPERQDYLYAQGRTRPGKIVTNATGRDMTSYHNWRLAFDCIQNKKGAEYDSAFLNKLGKIGQSIGLEWGGGWSGFKDAPHFQYTFGLSIKDLKSGKKPPEYNPKDTVYEKAVQNLVLEGIIGSPAAWTSINIKNVPALISKIGIRLFDVSTYDTAIAKMVEAKIINSPGIWQDKNYTEQNVRDLIVKVSSYLG